MAEFMTPDAIEFTDYVVFDNPCLGVCILDKSVATFSKKSLATSSLSQLKTIVAVVIGKLSPAMTYANPFLCKFSSSALKVSFSLTNWSHRYT